MVPLVEGLVSASLAMTPARQRSSPCSDGGNGGVRLTVQDPLIGARGLVRLLEPMQLDVTQQQRHHRPPAQDQAWVVLVRCALELIPQR